MDFWVENELNDFKKRIDLDYPAEDIEQEIIQLFIAYLKLGAASLHPQSLGDIDSQKTFIANALNAIAKYHEIDLFDLTFLKKREEVV